MRSSRRVLAALTLTLSVGPGGAACTVEIDHTPLGCEATAALTLAPAVAEIRSKDAIAVGVTLADRKAVRHDDHPLLVELVLPDGSGKTLLDAPSAEALAADGKLGAQSVSFSPADVGGAAPGAFTLRATLGCPVRAVGATPAVAETPVYLLRLGASAVAVGGGDGQRVPLMYSAVGHQAGNSFPIPADGPAVSLDVPAGEPDLDAPDGTARALPAPWEDLETPPTDAMGAVKERGASLPVSLTVDSRPDLTLTIGSSAAAAGKTVPSGLATAGLPALRVVVDGATPTQADAAPTEGGSLTFRLDATPVAAVGRFDVPVHWHFEAKGADDAWSAVPGARGEATVRLYGVLGNEMGTTAPNLPWVSVVDAAARKVDGKTKDVAAVRAALVEYVYQEMDLTYDRKAGASAYTDYTVDSWRGGQFDLGSFLKRGHGRVVNCSDCASILSTFANMVGAKLHYAIIGWNFPLNPIMGIGASDFGSPFTSGQLSFSYHAVTTPDATQSICDATLALDGDGDPKSAPHEKKLVQNVPGDEYLTRLSPGNPKYQYTDEATLVR